MIPYSIMMMPNPMDESQPKKAYARAQVTGVVTLDQFAAHISDHNNVYDKGDIYAVLTKAVKCLRELVLEGKKVCLGDLGGFSATLSSTGAATADEFTAANITQLTMSWDKGENLKNMAADALFRQVSSRAAQAAALKAQKAGHTSASWDSASVDEGEGDHQVDTGTGTGTGTGGDGTGTGGDDLGGNVG